MSYVSPYLLRPLRTLAEAREDISKALNAPAVAAVLADSEEAYIREEERLGDLPGHEVWKQVRRNVNNG